MKANQLLELSFCLVCVLASSTLLTLNGNQAATAQHESAIAYQRESIHGTVSARTDASLTVDDKVIGTTVRTSFVKDGEPISTDAVHVGDEVQVTISKGTDGSLQAVSVEVLVKS